MPWPSARAGEQVGREVQAFLVDGREISGTLQAVRGDTLSLSPTRFATHLLEDGYDIRTVQELLGTGANAVRSPAGRL